jgi:hypothetical protein
MPITVKWDNAEKTIIYYTFDGAWTWDEFNAVYQEVYAMLDTVQHKVHAIVDLRNSRLLPRDTLTQMRRLTYEQHENGGLTVFITTNAFAKTLYSILSNLYRRAREIFRLASTPQAAYNILHEYDKSVQQEAVSGEAT